MDNQKTGALIRALRMEKGYTQQQLAEQLNVSAKTISKWETAAGYPDISLITQLAQILDTTSEELLLGNMPNDRQNGGNMKRIKFYQCELCGNVLTSTGNATISCCGHKLLPLKARIMDEAHTIHIEELDDDFFITFTHDMTKEHHICFAAWVSYDRVMLVRMYPEQNAELHMNLPRRGDFYVCCSKDGLFHMKL
ncbi:MAG: helix-turn-helix domain-containing protein [Peptococcaceae bacterium]|nr:helix-turn-helix domain-containing protein [Peptococcaceae bacterium]MBQ3205506.1 helix-turn-helix domain-containing protein [Peptococcaceae bacterium]MBQ6852939.1 helix-turn-helix domain-containing protein [Peptococcaceae bacterium]